VIGLELAQALRNAGLAWNPVPGDRFVVANREMDDEVFVVSNMVIEVHDAPTGQIIGFNGTTEWALDSLEHGQVVWLPREAQLRELLADRFVRLESVTGGFAVTFDVAGERREVDGDAESAYARALLVVLGETTGTVEGSA
jgi:hypothetical protein